MATLEALPEPLLLQAAGSLQGLAALAGTSAGLQGHAQPWLGTAAYACKACGHRLFRPSLLTQVQQSGMAWGSAGPLLQLPRCAVEPPSSSTALGEEQPEPDVDVECEDEGAPSTPRCVLRRTRLPSGLLLGIEAPAAQEQELRQELWRVNSGLVPVQLWQDPSRVVLRVRHAHCAGCGIVLGAQLFSVMRVPSRGASPVHYHPAAPTSNATPTSPTSSSSGATSYVPHPHSLASQPAAAPQQAQPAAAPLPAFWCQRVAPATPPPAAPAATSAATNGDDSSQVMPSSASLTTTPAAARALFTTASPPTSPPPAWRLAHAVASPTAPSSSGGTAVGRAGAPSPGVPSCKLPQHQQLVDQLLLQQPQLAVEQLGQVLIWKRTVALQTPLAREGGGGGGNKPNRKFLCQGKRVETQTPLGVKLLPGGTCGALLFTAEDTLGSCVARDHLGSTHQVADLVSHLRPDGHKTCNVRSVSQLQGELQLADVLCARCGEVIGCKVLKAVGSLLGLQNALRVGRYAIFRMATDPPLPKVPGTG